jgi:anaerobic ribonucleoside-triphosphate reductase activating protein
VGEKLRVARFQEMTHALGPGSRAVVWFHGCSFNCPGCIAKEMNESSEWVEYFPRKLAERIQEIEGIEGVTLSGGDPLDQPLAQLAEFLTILKGAKNLSVMLYTGRTLIQLLNSKDRPEYEAVLHHVDILIDGLYVEGLNRGTTWKGSSNQKVHFLSPRYADLEPFISESRDRKLEVAISPRHEVTITGIPPRGFMQRFQEGLRSKDLDLNYTHRQDSL